jgi:hypothetical protein
MGYGCGWGLVRRSIDTSANKPKTGESRISLRGITSDERVLLEFIFLFPTTPPALA